MKNAFHKRIWLLIPALIMFSIIIALMSSSRAFAGDVQISLTKLNLYTNGGRKSIRLYIYDDGQPVQANWKSSKKKVAAVSSNGVVTAKKKGTAKITASYAGATYTCTIKVSGTSGVYKNCIKAYKSFLMNPYVTYTSGGKTAQADNFYSIDLDSNGIPELLVNVVDSSGKRYHVLYHFKDWRISTGQILGACSDFIWYPSRRIMNYRKIESDQSLYVYSRDNGTTLNSLAIDQRKHGKDTYYISDGSMGSYGTKISSLQFHNYVDRDLLNYSDSKRITLYVNTPYNRSRFLK